MPKAAAIIALTLAVLASGDLLYKNYRTEERSNYAVQANEAIAKEEEALRGDTYGGRTPEDTLAMLIDALEKGNVELASKYFALDVNTQSPDYLTRREWEDGLRQAQAENRTGGIIEILRRAEPDPENRSYQSDYKFAVYGPDGKIQAYIDMEFNKYSGTWKIQAF